MAFQVKDFLSIVASMVNHMRGGTSMLTDFNVGSVNRSMIEASAVEIDELYQQMLSGLTEAIPVSTYQSFNFDKLVASSAYVGVTFTVSPVSASAIVIDAGSKVKVPYSAISYLTDSEVIIPAGVATATVRVTADTPGIIGNTLANTITEIVAPISDVTVTNLLAAISGRDEESNDEQRVRFADYIRSLSRGPIGAIEYGAKTATIKNTVGDITERVTKASVVEPYMTDNAQPLGYDDCYIYNGVGSTSVELQIETQKVINGYYDADGNPVMGWKAAGVVCTVRLVAEQAEDVTGVLTVMPGYDVTAIAPIVQEQVTTYIQDLDIEAALILNEFVSIAMDVEGVSNVAFTVPAADVAPAENVKIIPGIISIS